VSLGLSLQFANPPEVMMILPGPKGFPPAMVK